MSDERSCEKCKQFFSQYRCNAPDECDCPKCQGTCCCDNEQFDDVPEMKTYPDDYDNFPDDGTESCHYCGGCGYGIVGVDWDTNDAINGPYDGEVEKCPCCGGSGDAADCTFW